jgi:hypothetical protein
MEEDKKRIGIGNSKFPSLMEEVKLVPDPDFTFDSVEVTFDSIVNTFDENINL